MKRLSTILLLALMAFSGTAFGQQKVMARFVPERYDDFIFENEYIAGRFYGQALESCGKGQIISPGIDVWVKTPGALVANQRYEDELKNGRSYHINWGNGKDCYKVGVSLGAGASSPLVDGVLWMPSTNFRSWKINEETDEKVVFTLSYPEWNIPYDVKVSLEKRITVTSGTYFCKCEDIYTFTGVETLEIAAGLYRRNEKDLVIEDEYNRKGISAFWEEASDQSAEPENGRIGIAIIVPGTDMPGLTQDRKHSICTRTIHSGDTFTYYFGSCWSKGNIKTADQWFKLVKDTAKALK